MSPGSEDMWRQSGNTKKTHLSPRNLACEFFVVSLRTVIPLDEVSGESRTCMERYGRVERMEDKSGVKAKYPQHQL